MTTHVILKGKDSFQREVDYEFATVSLPNELKIRRYERIESYCIYNPGEIVHVKDRYFFLKSQANVWGKSIAIYEER